MALADRPRRFSELRAALTPVTAKVLTATLRQMQDDGLARRHDLAANPPHVEYELTELGRSLLTVIDVLRAWSAEHLDELLRHRARAASASRV